MTPPDDWHGGWLPAAVKLPSPHCDARPANACVDLLVLHCISLPAGEWGTGAVQDLFLGRLDPDAHPGFASLRGVRVSSHFFIDRMGGLWQFVDCHARAWHAGASYWRGRSRCNDDSIGVELEGLPGRTFTAAQYRSLLHLCQCVARQYPIRHVAGHEHIAPGRKSDPGSGFDWPHLGQQLARHPQTRGWQLPPGPPG